MIRIKIWDFAINRSKITTEMICEEVKEVLSKCPISFDYINIIGSCLNIYIHTYHTYITKCAADRRKEEAELEYLMQKISEYDARRSEIK